MGKRFEQTIYRYEISTWKDVQHHQSLQKCKLTSLKDSSVNPLEWLKLKRLAIPIVCEEVEQLQFLCAAGGIVQWWIHFKKNSLVVS